MISLGGNPVRIGAMILFFAAVLSGCAAVGDYFGFRTGEGTAAARAAPAATPDREPLPARSAVNDAGSPGAERPPVAVTVMAGGAGTPASPVPVLDSQASVRTPLAGSSRTAPRNAGVPPDRLYRDVVLDEDTTWRGEVAVEGSLTVPPQTTLTVEPGTIVRFRRTAAGAGNGPVLLVQGRLVVRGTAESPVRFASAFAEPLAGDWEGVVFLGSEKRNSLDHCRIEGAAVGVEAAFSSLAFRQVVFAGCGTGTRLRSSVVSVEGGAAEGCSVGIELEGSEADILDLHLRGNHRGIVAQDSSLGLERGSVTASVHEGLVATESRVKLDGVRLERNGTGVVLDSCEGSVAGGRIAGNRDNGMVVARSRVKIVGNEISGNGAVGLRVEDGKAAAWGNVFSANGRHDIHHAGADDFRAAANWWGDTAASALEDRVFDQKDDPVRGRVLFLPPLGAKPLLPSVNSVAK